MFVVLTVVGGWLGLQIKWVRDRHAFLEAHDHAQIYVKSQDRRPSAPGALGLFGERGVYAFNTFEFDEDERTRAGRLFPEAHLITGPIAVGQVLL